MKTWIRTAAAVVLCLGASVAGADMVGDAKALLTAAHSELAAKGMDGAVREFNAGGKWRGGKAYVVVVDFKGNMLAHADNAKIVGKNMFEVRDAGGQAFIQEVIKRVQANGEAQIEFRWVNPQTKKIDNGRLMAKRVPGQDAYVGVSFFE